MVLAGPVPVVAAQDAGHRVVAKGLDNPRQLNWAEDGKALVIAEAGRGGAECAEEGCRGLTGAVTLVRDPGQNDPRAERVATGLFSFAAPDGSFALGSNGADATPVGGAYLIAGSDKDAPPELGGALLVALTDPRTGRQLTVSYVDLQAAEEEQNPDGAQIESNPYAVLYVDEQEGALPDGYALVADAAANTVWKIAPDFAAAIGDMELPPYEITPFVTFPTPPADEETPEFVPTSLATDSDGGIYVGGLGSEVPGAASVVKYSSDGKQLLRWDGFTGVTGVAVNDESLYVSQLFGSEEPTPGAVPGEVLKVDRSSADGKRLAIEVPLPAGLAADGDHVYASVNSIAPAVGVPAGAENPFGAVGGGAVWELDFSAARSLS